MVYVTSDLHGFSLERFQAFLAQVGFSDEDYLFILGDVIDRGDDGVAILRWLLVQPNVELILGNHEAMLLACDFLFREVDEENLASLDGAQIHSYRVWKSNGAQPTLNALRALAPEERADILEYLRECPLYDTVSLESGEFLLVHGGLDGYEEGRVRTAYSALVPSDTRRYLFRAFYDHPRSYANAFLRKRVQRTRPSHENLHQHRYRMCFRWHADAPAP